MELFKKWWKIIGRWQVIMVVLQVVCFFVVFNYINIDKFFHLSSAAVLGFIIGVILFTINIGRGKIDGEACDLVFVAALSVVATVILGAVFSSYHFDPLLGIITPFVVAIIFNINILKVDLPKKVLIPAYTIQFIFTTALMTLVVLL